MESMDILIAIAIMIICLIAEGFFSGSEIGVISADRMKLRHQAAEGSKGARLALEMLKKPEWLLSTTLVGTNIAVVTNTTMATALVIELLGPAYSWVAVVVVAPLIWVFGEIVPKSIFQQRADTITPRIIYILNFCSYLFYPILLVFSFLVRLFSRLVGGNQGGLNPFTLREEIKTMVQMSAEEGDIEPIEQNMIRRLFNFGETTAREVMMPLIDVVMIERACTCQDALAIAADKSHARIPVYQERVDRIIGVLDTLELLGVDGNELIASYIKPISYVAPSKSIQELLHDMRRTSEQVTVVVDEFGGAEGIVTIEDILEEVVEDMQDEYDAEEPDINWLRRLDDNNYLVSARIDLNDLAEELNVELPQGKYTSLAGFLLDRAGDVPSVGDTIHYQELQFTIQRATPRSVREVKVTLVP